MPRDPALDQTFDSSANDDSCTFLVEAELAGGWISLVLNDDGALEVAAELLGLWLPGIAIDDATMEVVLEWAGTESGSSWLGGPVWISTPAKGNWVQWSKIGDLDFTIDRSNVAGERPLDWRGTIWHLLKLGARVVAYGSNGISFLSASGVSYGLDTLTVRGIKNKLAAVDTRTDGHYFVSRDSQLWHLGDGLTRLDYAEYLSELGTVVLTWHPEERLLYLCDGAKGFVYSPDAKSLGRGPVNISGLFVQDSTVYVTAPAAVSIPVFTLTTDIYDFGTRKAKTIRSVEFGINATVQLDAKIEYRQRKDAAFLATNWYAIDRRGVRHLHCYGQEFRFALRAASAEWLRLDYVRINGIVHDH